MRCLLVTTILLVGLMAVHAQKPACPEWYLIGPDGIGVSREYKVGFKDPGQDPKNYAYQWTVSQGQLIAGQSTNRITVSFDTYVTVMVRLSGLPPGCPNTASESMVIDPAPSPTLIDKYGRISWKAEMKRINLLLPELSRDPNAQIVFLFTMTPYQSEDYAKKRVTRVLELLRKNGLEPQQFRLRIEAGTKLYTRIYSVPAGAQIPACKKEQCHFINS
jgi:hypothetical protein